MKMTSPFTSLCFACLLCGALAGCYETTETQRDYTTARDSCRERSELESNAIAQANGPTSKEYKVALLSSFSECMGEQGWSVTGPDKGDRPKPGIPAVPAPVMVSPLAPPATSGNDLRMKRAAECAYARHASSHSSNARAMARACDMECRSARRASPDAPLPAACAP